MYIERGGVVAAQCRWSTTAGWGRILFRRSRADTAPFRVAITTALFAESRLFYACFFLRHAVGSWAAGGLRCVTWSRGQGAWRQTRRLSEDGDGVHHSHSFYDRPAELGSQIEAGRPT